MTIKKFLEQLKEKNIPLDACLKIETDFFELDDTVTLYPNFYSMRYSEESNTVFLPAE